MSGIIKRHEQQLRWIKVKGSLAILQSLQEHNNITREERLRLTEMVCSPDEENFTIAEILIDDLIKKIEICNTEQEDTNARYVVKSC